MVSDSHANGVHMQEELLCLNYVKNGEQQKYVWDIIWMI